MCPRFSGEKIPLFTLANSRGRIVELATNCYGCHVLQKALDCEEDIRLLVVSELLVGDPATTLVNKHASHIWSKGCFQCRSFWIDNGIDWYGTCSTYLRLVRPFLSSVPFITNTRFFSSVKKSLKGKWATLACHETVSLVIQVHIFHVMTLRQIRFRTDNFTACFRNPGRICEGPDHRRTSQSKLGRFRRSCEIAMGSVLYPA